MNPYAPQLGNRDPLEVTRATPAKLRDLVNAFAPEKLKIAPAPGKWSVRDVLSHLADCEVVFAFRLRQALAEDHPVVQPFDQDKWAATYAGYEPGAALNVFAALRQWNLAFIDSLQPAAFAKKLNHPERGDMTLRTVVETMAGHDINHIRQIEAIRV
jgi:uncharacterized damage-inducible protein DinB